MHHHVTVDGVAPRVSALCGRQRATDVALLLKDVVPLHGKGGRVAFQEALRELCVPYQLVRVHRRVVVAAPTVLPDVRGQAHVPREVHLQVASVGEVVCVHVGVFLKLVPRVLVVDVAGHTHFQQVVAEVQVQPFPHVGAFRRALPAEVDDLVGGDILAPVVDVGADVSHGIRVIAVREGGEVEILLFPHGGVEHHARPCVPVPVDVHGHGGALAGSLVVEHGRADAVVGQADVRMHHPSALLVGYVVVVEDGHAVRPRRLQPRVALRYVQRVGVVGHVQQVGHGGLGGAPVVAQAQLSGVRELIPQVDARRPIHHVAHYRRVQRPFLVVHIGLLGLQRDAGVEARLAFPVTEHHGGVLVVFLVRGILAVLCVDVSTQHVCPWNVRDVLAIIYAVLPQRVYQLGEFIHRAVGIGVAVLVTVAELQVCPREQRLAVTQVGAEVVVLGGIGAVTPGVVVLAVPVGIPPQEVVHVRDAVRIAFRVGIPPAQVQADVAPLAVQPAVQQQRAVERIAVPIAVAPPLVVIHHDAVLHVFFVLRQRVCHSRVRVVVERDGTAQAVAVIL